MSGPARKELRDELLAAERRRVPLRPHGGLRVAVAYPNTYRVAMSSLAFQWVTELAMGLEDVGVERAFADEELAGRTLETGASLAAMDVVAFSMAFELDAPNLLRMLTAAGIPERAPERGPGDPLVVLGGSAAMIDPLPLAPAVDVICLGAAERTWPGLLELVRDTTDRERLLDELASREGYLVPSRHLDASGRPVVRLRRLEKRRLERLPWTMVPVSHAVTPHTEYASRALVEMSRGCPEKCRYCWISHASGNPQAYAAEAILARVEEAAAVTRRIGFVATAVGDHPEIARILQRSVDRGLDVALSSLRIPAMVPEVLEPLVASGARSVTIAPETGSDRLRFALRKPIPNERILAAAETAFRTGLSGLKMYFIVGLPGEEDQDLAAIGGLVRAVHGLGEALVPARDRARHRGGWLRVGASILVPKPYTPYHAEGMLSKAEARRRLDLLHGSLRGLPGVRFDRPSVREAHWQGYLSRAGTEAFPLLQEVARGAPLSAVMRAHREEITAMLRPWSGGPPPWHIISAAPSAPERG